MASLAKLSTYGDDGSVQVVVESPRGSNLKLKYDPKQQAFGLSRPLVSGVTYPYDWGFVPSTRGPDGDPIDAMIFWQRASFPGLVLSCRLIASLEVEQNSAPHPGARERNDRLIAVPVKAPECESIVDVGDIPPRIKAELEEFFISTTLFEQKELRILGWGNAARARELVEKSAR